MASFNEVTKSVGTKRVTERVPYHGAGVEALGVQVSALLKAEQEAQRIVLDVTKGYIHLEKMVKGQPDTEEEQERLDNALRNIEMREFVTEKKLAPTDYLHGLFRQITDDGLEVCLIVIGNHVSLDKWIPISKRNPRLFGVRIKRLKSVPEDVILVCGAEWVEAEFEDIRLTVKGVMG